MVSAEALIEDPFSLDAGFFLNDQSLASLIAGDGAQVPECRGLPPGCSWAAGSPSSPQ
jgi:hypothetical protein